ncbi:hypothetical protein GQ53DRAFT_764833 [Thozetella sp. PMI_491]|nr:hypothetical protein GQ53DRAFT_764833 [Thozetella sp. PMI_491]
MQNYPPISTPCLPSSVHYLQALSKLTNFQRPIHDTPQKVKPSKQPGFLDVFQQVINIVTMAGPCCLPPGAGPIQTLCRAPVKAGINGHGERPAVILRREGTISPQHRAMQPTIEFPVGVQATAVATIITEVEKLRRISTLASSPAIPPPPPPAEGGLVQSIAPAKEPPTLPPRMQGYDAR